MKDVLLVNYTGRKGGGPLDAFEMSKALIDADIPVAAIVSNQIENLALWKQLSLEKLVIIPTYTSKISAIISTLLFPFKQRSIIKRELKGFNIKYIYCPMGTLWSQKINRIYKKSYKSIVIHDPIPHSGEEKRIHFKRNPYRNYDLLLVHTKQFIEYVQTKYNKPTEYIQLGKHDLYKKISKKVTLVSYSPETINFMFFGRISKYKGLDVLAEAYKIVLGELGEKVTLTIIGSGDFSPYAKLYESLQNVKVINRWIRDEETESAFLGPNLICLCPYTDATQSGVAYTAMDYGVPLVISNTGGVGEQVIDGATGILIPPSNAEALARAMIELAENATLRERISEEQRKYVATIGWDTSAKQLIEVMGISI